MIEIVFISGNCNVSQTHVEFLQITNLWYLKSKFIHCF